MVLDVFRESDCASVFAFNIGLFYFLAFLVDADRETVIGRHR